jgi:hypothetical protein
MHAGQQWAGQPKKNKKGFTSIYSGDIYKKEGITVPQKGI